MIRNCITFDFKYIPSHIEKAIYLSVDCWVYHFPPGFGLFIYLFIFFLLFFFNTFYVFISHFMCLLVHKNKNNKISVITKIFELEKYTIVRKDFYAVAFVTDNPKLAFLSEPNSQGVVVWWFLSFAKMAYSPSINTRLIEAYEKA